MRSGRSVHQTRGDASHLNYDCLELVHLALMGVSQSLLTTRPLIDLSVASSYGHMVAAAAAVAVAATAHSHCNGSW